MALQLHQLLLLLKGFYQFREGLQEAPDCATDSSGKLCDELAKSDRRIQVLHLAKNGGLSNARNQGMAVANGEYILFLDPDDRYDVRLLEQIRGESHLTMIDLKND